MYYYVCLSKELIIIIYIILKKYIKKNIYNSMSFKEEQEKSIILSAINSNERS